MKKCFALLCLIVLLGSTALAEDTPVQPLPMDFTPGPVAAEENYTDSSYEDASISVQVEKVTTDLAVFCVARVKIADASQLRTAVTPNGKTNKISTLARKNNAVIAIGGEYFASDEGGLIIRMGEIQGNKRKPRKTPYETRDLLCIDENGDFHIILRLRDPHEKKKKVNETFEEDLEALRTEHTLVNVFDFGPALIRDGELCEIPDNYSFNPNGAEPRCAIGQVGPLEYLLVVVDTLEHHARNNGQGATCATLARFMQERGCTEAYNLDGGNSCLMVFHGENYSDKTFNEERSVSDIIYFATAISAE